MRRRPTSLGRQGCSRWSAETPLYRPNYLTEEYTENTILKNYWEVKKSGRGCLSESNLLGLISSPARLSAAAGRHSWSRASKARSAGTPAASFTLNTEGQSEAE